MNLTRIELVFLGLESSVLPLNYKTKRLNRESNSGLLTDNQIFFHYTIEAKTKFITLTLSRDNMNRATIHAIWIFYFFPSHHLIYFKQGNYGAWI